MSESEISGIGEAQYDRVSDERDKAEADLASLRQAATEPAERVFDIQQEAARIAYIGADKQTNAEWFANELVAALATYEQAVPDSLTERGTDG